MNCFNTEYKHAFCTNSSEKSWLFEFQFKPPISKKKYKYIQIAFLDYMLTQFSRVGLQAQQPSRLDNKWHRHWMQDIWSQDIQYTLITIVFLVIRYTYYLLLIMPAYQGQSSEQSPHQRRFTQFIGKGFYIRLIWKIMLCFDLIWM